MSTELENLKSRSNLPRSFQAAWVGIVGAFKHERNFQIHIIITVTVIAFLLIFGATAVEWAVIVGFIALVLVAELLNTVLEHLLDYFKPEVNPAIKMMKDMAAGAVLVAAVSAVVAGCLIIIPKISSWFT